MRILDQDNDNKLDQICIYLRLEEAKELRDFLDDLISNPPAGQHRHVSSEDFQKEITVCLYDKNNKEIMQQFDKRSIKLIEKDI